MATTLQGASQNDQGLPGIMTLLRIVRRNLGMDVAFVGQFVERERVFRHVDANSDFAPIRVGDASPSADSYCLAVVEGRLPELIPDTAAVPATAAFEATRTIPVGAHMSVPIRLSSGVVYGTFCCFSRTPDPTLNGRDLAMLRTFADIAAQQIDREMRAESLRLAKIHRVRTALSGGGPAIVYQPVFLMETMQPVGSEALSRFADADGRAPDAWFVEAAEVGLGIDLELAAIRNALEGYRDLWRDHPSLQLGLNASADTICDPRLSDLIADYPMDRIVIELTEHEAVEDYGPLVARLRSLQARGVRIAVDDVGAGHSSMRHILSVRPNIMKLDGRLIRFVDADPMKFALVATLTNFADQFGCKIVVEGVETEAELERLRTIPVQAAQGFLLAQPESAEALKARMAASAPRPFTSAARPPSAA